MLIRCYCPKIDMSESLFSLVRVAVNRPLFQTFTYKVPHRDNDLLKGRRIKVNFAGSEQIGIILEDITDKCGSDEETLSKVKSGELLDNTPILDDDILKMVTFGSSYYHYPIGQCLWTALPKILRDGGVYAYEAIPGLELIADSDSSCAKLRSPEQREIIEVLKAGPVRRKILRERGFSSQSENALIKKGLVRKINLEQPQQHWQDNLAHLRNELPPDPNDEQQQAIDTIAAKKGFGVFLLNGITGSGKTEVYLRVIEQVLRGGKAVLVLVPEIALTPQTFSRFYRRFNVPVASVHSQLSDRERLDAYLDMAKGSAAILIGTRTALFTPIPNLGLIVLDEEHDSSFKQSDGFRYHARSLALIRAQQIGCPVILGSATPSLESIANVQKGNFIQLKLTLRAGGAKRPDFNIIDLRHEPVTDGLKAGISRTLEDKIGEETAKGNQVLLFLNRRGFSHHLLCHQCGHVFCCPNCDTVLTVHHADGRLHCHICENSFPIPGQCPVCKSGELDESGFGTEQVEQFLTRRYPDTGLERIDRDNVTNKVQLEKHLEKIRNGQSQILLGTQMIAKGHDFPNVTLVGILDVDSGLFSDDFRSLELTAQLLTQVAGRAGRALKNGTVYLQTHYPDNLLINQITDPACSYDDISTTLLESRRKLKLPPYYHQAFLLSNSTDRKKAHYLLTELLTAIRPLMREYPDVTATPVLSDKIEKRHSRYHFHVLLSSSSRQSLSSVLDGIILLLKNMSLKGDVRFAVEVDPLSSSPG